MQVSTKQSMSKYLSALLTVQCGTLTQQWWCSCGLDNRCRLAAPIAVHTSLANAEGNCLRLCCCMLQEVDLSGNKLSGPIPTFYASLTQLVVLRLGHNQLQGTLPAPFVSLRALAVMDVSNNLLTGAARVVNRPLTRQCAILSRIVDDASNTEATC